MTFASCERWVAAVYLIAHGHEPPEHCQHPDCPPHPEPKETTR